MNSLAGGSCGSRDTGESQEPGRGWPVLPHTPEKGTGIFRQLYLSDLPSLLLLPMAPCSGKQPLCRVGPSRRTAEEWGVRQDRDGRQGRWQEHRALSWGGVTGLQDHGPNTRTLGISELRGGLPFLKRALSLGPCTPVLFRWVECWMDR